MPASILSLRRMPGLLLPVAVLLLLGFAATAQNATPRPTGKKPGKAPAPKKSAVSKAPWQYLPNPDNLPAPVPPPATPETKINPIDGAEIVWIPAGTFIRGSNSDRLEERPQRLIYLDGYWVYKYPVTVAQFRKFLQAANYAYAWSYLKPSWGWLYDHPMTRISRLDVEAYARWAGGELPTEAQWEKAARGTDGRKFPWGESYDDSKAWCSVKTGRGITASVYRTNNVSLSPFGCVDMAGNVWQLCRDWYGEPESGDGNYRDEYITERYYETAPSRNPLGPNRGRSHVMRGGSWESDSTDDLRAARRNDESNLFGNSLEWGFRLVLSQSAGSETR